MLSRATLKSIRGEARWVNRRVTSQHERHSQWMEQSSSVTMSRAWHHYPSQANVLGADVQWLHIWPTHDKTTMMDKQQNWVWPQRLLYDVYNSQQCFTPVFTIYLNSQAPVHKDLLHSRICFWPKQKITNNRVTYGIQFNTVLRLCPGKLFWSSSGFKRGCWIDLETFDWSYGSNNDLYNGD